MTGIGGFFELELPKSGRPYHESAVSLCSGRACLRLILEATRPREALVPFFVCDSVLKPFEEAGVRVTFYRLTSTLEPILPEVVPRDAALVYVNYFGLKTACAERMASSASPVIIDDTESFFQRGYERAWSFNSARKFFGVPDGAYAYGPGLQAPTQAGRLEDVSYDHLVNRLLGRQHLAYQQYVESERHVCSSLLRVSELTERLLALVDYHGVSEARRRNFAAMHKRLGGLNQLVLDLDHIDQAVPFCYPFLPGVAIPLESLWRRQIFVPGLWPEIASRPHEGFAWERQLASNLLALPIDHRYGAEHIQQVCDAVIEESGRRP